MKKSTKETTSRVLFSRSISASSSSWRFDGFWWSDLSLHVLCINLCGCFLQHRLAHVCLGCSSCWSWSFHFGAKAHQTWSAGASKKPRPYHPTPWRHENAFAVWVYNYLKKWVPFRLPRASSVFLIRSCFLILFWGREIYIYLKALK